MEASAIALRPRPWRWRHPRVLVEHPDEGTGLAIAAALRLAGYAVGVCAGPRERGQCPLTEGDGCVAAYGADLVVSCLGQEREEAREVLDALATRCANVPLLVEAPADLDAGRDLPQGCRILAAPATPARVVDAVGEMLDRGRA